MSPRLSSEELKKAREKKKRERDEMDRQERLEEIEHIKTRIKLEQISSELDGLYEELDKIYKKAPEEQISSLTVENVNALIKDTKEIINEDPYIDRVKEFVPAGDNPEYRDVIMVLRQLKQGLKRFKEANFAMYHSLSDLTVQLEQLESEEE
jgi:hypothetical protein